jgi:hypothetical protein
VTSIGDSSFGRCTSLSDVKISDGVESIGYQAFIGCTSLADIDIPDSVSYISKNAFDDTAIDENQTGATYIGDWIVGCDSDVTSLEIKDGTKKMASFDHGKLTNLTSVTIPGSISEIPSGAFNTFTKLESVTIGYGVEYIDWWAFDDCISLKEIEIPESVRYISKSAFAGCDNLESITILNPDCYIYNDEYTINDTAVIYGYDDSTAQEYAEEYSRTFVSLGAAPEYTVSSVVKLEKTLLNTDELTDEEFEKYDMNSDGIVNVFDLILLKRKLLN